LGRRVARRELGQLLGRQFKIFSVDDDTGLELRVYDDVLERTRRIGCAGQEPDPLGVTLRRQATKPLTDLVDLVYFGSGAQEDVPPLNLRLPRAYRAERCYEKAVLECERLMEWHSLAPELWAELILAKRRGGLGGGQEEEITRNRALECLGMIHRPSLFDRMLRDRNDLPDFPAGLASQFER
jgi:hypothetical protein